MDKKTWIILGSVAAIIGLLIAAYFIFTWYEKNQFLQPDTTDVPDQNSNMSADYRSQTSLPLGIQNNNPGNIRDAGIPWQGRVGANRGFVVFSDMAHGIRAFVKNIVALIDQYGTLQAYINAYAPPGDNNDTSAYVTYVSNATGIAPDQKPSLNHDTLKALAKAHFEVENRKQDADQYISDADIEAGLAMTPYGAGII